MPAVASAKKPAAAKDVEKTPTISLGDNYSALEDQEVGLPRSRQAT